MAFDKACALEGSKYGSVSLKAFLAQLLPEDQTETILETVIPPTLTNPRVACLQFVHLANGFQRRTLIELADRRCGASFIEGQCGADLVIPILSTAPSFISIQVKNLSSCQKHCGYSAAACFELFPSRVLRKDRIDGEYCKSMDASSVRLFMQLGARVPSVHVTANSKSRADLPNALEIFGMPPRCLAQGQNKALTGLLNGRVYLESFIQDNLTLSPNPDANGSRLRKAWHFIVDRLDVDEVA